MSDLEERVARVLFDKINEHHVTDPFEDRECLLVDCYLDLDYLARAAIAVCAEEMAKVADNYGNENGMIHQYDDEGAVKEEAAEEIAAAIRSIMKDKG